MWLVISVAAHSLSFCWCSFKRFCVFLYMALFIQFPCRQTKMFCNWCRFSTLTSTHVAELYLLYMPRMCASREDKVVAVLLSNSIWLIRFLKMKEPLCDSFCVCGHVSWLIISSHGFCILERKSTGEYPLREDKDYSYIILMKIPIIGRNKFNSLPFWLLMTGGLIMCICIFFIWSIFSICSV